MTLLVAWTAVSTAAPAPRPAPRQPSAVPGQLLGFNRPGTEWPCVQGWGIFDGPADDAAVSTITSWQPNTVRVPLNEHCWLGINGVPAEYGGANYQNAIAGWVGRLTGAGVNVVLDLHWSAAGTASATGQQKMANADHSPDFWRSVATRFKGNARVLFDLYNEPHDISDACWRDGCVVDGWQAAGMQSLVDAVRSTGATQPLLVTCNGWGNGCGGWLAYRPDDPLHNIVASVHVYDYTGCNTEACWDADVAPIAAQVPTVFGEFGDTDCDHDFSDRLTAWASPKGIGWLAWGWYPGDCGFPGLIADWNGTPSGYGAGVRDRLLDAARTETS
ncbi:cellulase family glycosylhydrolase [Flindersiella endophytica]